MIAATALAFATLQAHGEGRFVEVRGNKLDCKKPLLNQDLKVYVPSDPATAILLKTLQAKTVSAFRTVIGVDRRGHGHSPDNGEPFSYKEMSEDMAALIVTLGVAPVDVVGHSDGGNIGLILARDHPGLVRRLVVSGANLKPGLAPADRACDAHRRARRLLGSRPCLRQHVPRRPQEALGRQWARPDAEADELRVDQARRSDEIG